MANSHFEFGGRKMESLEARYVNLLRGGEDNSPLATDGYKFSMGQAGTPLRHEVFYLHFRKGGALYVPFDLKEVIRLLQPRLPNTKEQGFLHANGYGLTPAMESALKGDLHVLAMPKGSWVGEREPVATISGPSFLVSWLEALCIALHFPMQVATALIDGVTDFTATCADEAEIIHLVAEAMNHPQPRVDVDERAFRHNIRDNIARLRKALEGDIERAFEVGTRSMTCMAMHRIVLEECRAAGINRTANVQLAYDLYMIPVGTTGHEHQMRWAAHGGGDEAGFRAIRDMRPEPPSYLFDTFNPITSGIPAAIEVMLEDRTRRCSVRFDSGDQERQLREFVAVHEEKGINPFYLFMDGYDHARVAQMEAFARSLDVPASHRHYGLGSYLVSSPAPTNLTRDRVAMVYKLSQTGGPGNQFGGEGVPVMKFSGTLGKSSLPGFPYVLVLDGKRIIAQQGEGLFGQHTALTKAPRPTEPAVLSPLTEKLVERMQANVSVFNKDVSVPKVAYPFDVIPKEWRGWYEAVLEKGDRCAPPGGVVVVGVFKPVVKAVTGAMNLILEEIGVFDGNVTGVWANGNHLVVATDAGLWMDGRRVGDFGDTTTVGFSPKMATPVAVCHPQGIPSLYDCVSRSPVPFGLNAQHVMGADGRVYLKLDDKVLELVLTDIGNKVVASNRLAATVLPNASLLFPGGVAQDILGSAFISLFPEAGSTHQVRIPELDAYRVLDAKFDAGAKGGVLMVVGIKGGKYDRLVFRFDEAYRQYDVRKVEGIQPVGINFVVTDAGVCVCLNENDEIELSSVKMGSAQVKTVTDNVLGGDMRLFKRGSQVLVARGDRVYSMRMK